MGASASLTATRMMHMFELKLQAQTLRAVSRALVLNLLYDSAIYWTNERMMVSNRG